MKLTKEDMQTHTRLMKEEVYSKTAVNAEEEIDTHFLLEDIVDTLMERYFDVGTNIHELFPNTYCDKNKIYLVNHNGKAQFILTLRKRG